MVTSWNFSCGLKNEMYKIVPLTNPQPYCDVITKYPGRRQAERKEENEYPGHKRDEARVTVSYFPCVLRNRMKH